MPREGPRLGLGVCAWTRLVINAKIQCYPPRVLLSCTKLHFTVNSTGDPLSPAILSTLHLIEMSPVLLHTAYDSEPSRISISDMKFPVLVRGEQRSVGAPAGISAPLGFAIPSKKCDSVGARRRNPSMSLLLTCYVCFGTVAIYGSSFLYGSFCLVR